MYGHYAIIYIKVCILCIMQINDCSRLQKVELRLKTRYSRAVRRTPAGAPAFFARPEPELELPFQLQLVRQNKDNILREWIIVC